MAGRESRKKELRMRSPALMAVVGASWDIKVWEKEIVSRQSENDDVYIVYFPRALAYRQTHSDE